MSRWGTLFTRLAPGRGEQPGSAPGEPDTTVLVDEYDGLTLLRATEQAVPGPQDAAELARSLGAEGGRTVATVVVGVDGPVPPGLWTRLGDVLDALRGNGTTTVRLVVSGAGSGTPDRPALAQRIADTWGLGVIAPEGNALLVPGGTLFVPDAPEPSGGWQLFQPGTEPTPLGARHPAPGWQTAFAALPEHTTAGHAVRPVPAGVLLQPPGTPPPVPGDLCYAVPVDAAHPTVLVGVPGRGGGARIPADDLAALLAALPAAVRDRIRVAPGAEGDLLPVVQEVTGALDIEVEVLTGPPLAVRAATPDDGDLAAGPVLVDITGRPTWRPYVEAVMCHPGSSGGSGSSDEGAEAAAPRLLRWRSPVPDAQPQDAGVVRLSERWQVTMTRSGLALGPAGQPLPLTGRPVLADQLAVEIGPSDEPLDESCWTALSHVLDYLDPEAREYTVLHAPGRSAEESRMLRRLAVQHGVRMPWPPTAGADPEALPEPVGAEPPAPAGGDTPAPDGFTLYRDRIGGIVQAANAGRYDDATALATALEREAFTAHGSEHPTALQIRQIRAHVMRLAGHNALAADLYRRVAFSLLVTSGLDSVDAEQAAANADACWRDTGDIALALRIAPSIIALRQKLPGPDGRWLRAAERYRDQLDTAHAVAPAPELPSAVPVPVPAPTAPAAVVGPAPAIAPVVSVASVASVASGPGGSPATANQDLPAAAVRADAGRPRVVAVAGAAAAAGPAAASAGAAARTASRPGPASPATGPVAAPTVPVAPAVPATPVAVPRARRSAAARELVAAVPPVPSGAGGTRTVRPPVVGEDIEAAAPTACSAVAGRR
ncbi:hypothetical protein [Streptomyces sp. NPDC001601]|uniref:hypothetical protein n=1 Tax=Streptomyces sp. NPDC001601 TaxID=3364592 RepID=UPI003691CD92